MWNPSSAKTCESFAVDFSPQFHLAVVRHPPSSGKTVWLEQQRQTWMWPFAEMSRVWTGFSGDNYQLYCVTDFREAQKVCAGQAGSGRCPSIPVYFHGASLEIAEISDKLVQVRSFMPWSSESAHTTWSELLKLWESFSSSGWRTRPAGCVCHKLAPPRLASEGAACTSSTHGTGLRCLETGEPVP